MDKKRITDPEDLDRNPGLARREVELKGGSPFLLRPLDGDDSEMLGDYFEGLSEKTINLFSPHDFDRETARKICAEHEPSQTLVLVAIQKSGDCERIAAYFRLDWRLRSAERSRYQEYGFEPEPDRCCTLAPSVAEGMRGRGLGSAMFRLLADIARQTGRRYMVLAGGVRSINKRARRYYRKHGFQKVGEFQSPGAHNIDMYRVNE